MTPPGKNLEVHFKGKIEQIFDGAALDAESYMKIDGKKVVFNAGIWGTVGIGIKGEIIGFNLSGDLEGKKYVGKMAEVYAIKDIEAAQAGDPRLTLQGSKKYYIKLIK